jgi:hypothetical protein
MGGFSQWGDKLLASITGICGLLTTQATALHISPTLMAWITTGSAAATLVHTIVFPNTPPSAVTFSPSTKQGGSARVGFLFALLAVALTACASLGLTAPQGAQQQIAYAYSGVTAALNTLAQATAQGLISSSDATQANAAILAVKTELDTANTEITSNEPAAVAAITAATATLATISAYLACKQAKEATCQL